MLYLYMKERNHSNVTFVIIAVLKRVTCNNMVQSDLIAVLHDGKKPLKSDVCYCECLLKRTMNQHVTSVHERKKPFKCEFVIIAVLKSVT